jgi:glyoxylase-like metal-dependent hydrolase (beta-lactamase superfamily II)
MDHVGNAAAIKRATGAMIAIGAEDAPALAGQTGLLRKLVNRAMKVEYLEPDLVLKDGDRMGGFQVIAVPGHTAGSLALWRPRDRVLVSGDALLTDKRGNERAPRKVMAYDYSVALRSAVALRQLDYKLLLPGHGRPRIVDDK